MNWELNRLPKTQDPYLVLMSEAEVRKAQAFHRSIPGYEPTPLARLSHLADDLGLKGLFVKDESFRFGLNSFKVLGGAYAISRFISQKTGRSGLTYEDLTSPSLKEELGSFTFITATDGNHGRCVAWAARQLGQKAVVFMPKGTSPRRLQNILNEGATATIEEGNYDDCVRLAAEVSARTPNSVVVQDTAWEGYEDIPAWIMQGYGAIALEADLQMQLMDLDRPSHVFVQAGVGTFAGAIQGYFANRFPESPPRVVVVEAAAADCYCRSAAAGDGDYRVVEGDIRTVMAGLACGTPYTTAWDILKNHSFCFLSCPDWVTAKGMRILAAPMKGDIAVVSGESGAVNTGAIVTIMQREEYSDLRSALGLDRDSVVLTFSTEGDTDPERYRHIVWDGVLPDPYAILRSDI